LEAHITIIVRGVSLFARCVFVWDALPLRRRVANTRVLLTWPVFPLGRKARGYGERRLPTGGRGVDGKNPIYGGGRGSRESDASLPGEGA